ncbi:glycosyltransferase [uncultured Amnibacterium sp.]|uniref:glycosyltransferase n=1 Tax=uncultured Amnibacterium sp. TaxID=1631851 RepID=UPI0035CAA82B
MADERAGQRILHVSSAFDIDFPGGITNYVRTLAASQVADGQSVFVLDGGALTDWTPHGLGFAVRGDDATRVDHFSLRSPEDAAKSRDVLQVVRAVRPDIVHFHLTIGLGVEFYRRFSDLGVPYVISLHDYYLYCPRITMMDFTNEDCGGPERAKCERCIGVLDQVDLLRRGARKLSLPLPRIRSSSVTRRNDVIAGFFARASRVLAVSGRVEELFRRVYPDAKYLTSHIGSASALVERPAPTRSDVLRVTALGTLSKYKGAEVLAAIAGRLPRDRVRVRFFGRVDEPRWGRLAEQAGIELRGAYVPADLPGIMADTDVGVMVPVWEDNAPQVVMEFLNYGIPVVATRMGGIPDFVDERNGLLFDHRRPTEVDRAVQFLAAMTATQAASYRERIGRLETPDSHRRELRSVYAASLVG